MSIGFLILISVHFYDFNSLRSLIPLLVPHFQTNGMKR